MIAGQRSEVEIQLSNCRIIELWTQSGRDHFRCWQIVLKNSAVEAQEFANSFGLVGGRPEAMMGPQVEQAALFCEFLLERHVPATHMLDCFVDLSDVRSHLGAILQLYWPAFD